MENQELRVSFGVLYVGVVSLSGQTQLEQLQLQLQFCKYFAKYWDQPQVIFARLSDN